MLRMSVDTGRRGELGGHYCPLGIITVMEVDIKTSNGGGTSCLLEETENRVRIRLPREF